MCSVNFIYKQNLTNDQLKSAIKAMATISKHRGPDATEILVHKNFAFGFNRLEIVGGNLGSQPIFDQKNDLVLICNGEIFNYRELKHKYFPNEKFMTTSDVEVIMYLYRKFGEKSISYLEGQFSFLLFDIKKQKIIIGRDRFGINPLFYYLKDNTFIVASEIKSLLATNQVKNINLNPEGIAESLLFYGAVPPKTCFSNIFQLPPSSYAIYNLNKKDIKNFRYWEITLPKNKLKNNELSKKQLEKLLIESVKKRLQGVSTPGVYLSGGLDSSIIGSLVAKLTKNRTEFFSIAFKDERYDESKYQILLSEFLKIKINQVVITNEVIINYLKESIFHVETPLIRCAPIPMLLLSKVVKERGIKFVLCGEGADELFAGYPVFFKQIASFEDKWDHIKQYLNIFNNETILTHAEAIYKQLISENMNEDKLVENRKKEINTKLSQYLLVSQGDRMSMANGIEQRFPFLDKDIADFAFSLHENLLIDQTHGKKILRDAFNDYLPDAFPKRKKQGYLAPDDTVVIKILSNPQYDYLLEKTYFDKVNIFNYEKINDLINKLKAGDFKDKFIANIVLFVITTHILFEIFIEKKFTLLKIQHQ